MAVLNNNQLGGASGQAGGYFLTDSLRFRSSASAQLSRTPSSAGNRKTYTYSCWVKKSAITVDAAPYHDPKLFFAEAGGNTNDQLGFLSTNTLRAFGQVSGSDSFNLTTTQLFRDSSAWYHIVLAVDTTQSTAANRVKLYVNGTQITAFSSVSYPSLNFDCSINNNIAHYIGSANSANSYLDGYLTEVNFVDGTALAPSDFGETDDNGTWIPKKYTGTYGTNGFYLKGRGTDNSGNSNNFTENNFNTTNSALTTYDIMSDVPTLTDEDTANFATFNPIAIGKATGGGSAYGAADGNLLGPNTGSGGWAMTSTTMSIPAGSGKFYFEVTVGSTGESMSAGVQVENTPFAGDYIVGRSDANGFSMANDGKKYNNNTGVAYGSATSAGGIIGVAVDASGATSTLTFYVNNVSQGIAYSSIAGNLVPSFSSTAGASQVAINFGQRPFAYTPPTGFKKLNTFNLPDSTIKDGSKHFNTVTYTGDGATRSITGVGLSPDFLWIKGRSYSFNHMLFDSVRGAGLRLMSDSTSAEASYGQTSFDADGWSMAGTMNAINESGQTYVAWNWRGSDSTAVSNTDGTITSTVSANTTAGFSIVTYAGNSASSATVGHGLGIAPKMVIVKGRNLAEGFPTQVDGTYGLRLNSTGANDAANGNVFFANTAPTTSVFTVGGSNEVNDGYNYVAYCFAEVEGYSKFGSYTGNGSTDGPFVYTGFRPSWIMVKSSTSASNWSIWDNKRPSYNLTNLALLAENSIAEQTGTYAIDILSNGFKLRNTAQNDSGQTFIYMAFAENPFKNSNAR